MTQVSLFPAPVNHAAYLAALESARDLRSDRVSCCNYLRSQLQAEAIAKTDAQTIWRGLFASWSTPFDNGR
jgi:hypothetical protein